MPADGMFAADPASFLATKTAIWPRETSWPGQNSVGAQPDVHSSMKERLDLLVERIRAGHVGETVADVERPDLRTCQRAIQSFREARVPVWGRASRRRHNGHRVAADALAGQPRELEGAVP